MSKPNIAQKGSYVVEVQEGKKYFWCACGLSQKQPFCDGNHKGTDFSPIIVDNDKEGNIAWCGCKCSGNPPYCDGAHSKL